MVHCSRGVAAEQGLLMGEMPDARAPVLQIDVLQPRFRPQQQFDGPAVQPGGGQIHAGGLGQQRGLRASSSTTRRASQVDAAAARAGKDVKGPIDGHPRGNVEQSAAAPAGRLQGGELVVAGRDARRSRCGRSRLRHARSASGRGCRRARPGRPTAHRACIDTAPLSKTTVRPASSTPSVNRAAGAGASPGGRGNPNSSG